MSSIMIQHTRYTKNYTKLLNVQERGEKVEPMFFIHIPLNEYVDAYKQYEKSGFDPSIGFG